MPGSFLRAFKSPFGGTDDTNRPKRKVGGGGWKETDTGGFLKEKGPTVTLQTGRTNWPSGNTIKKKKRALIEILFCKHIKSCQLLNIFSAHKNVHRWTTFLLTLV